MPVVILAKKLVYPLMIPQRLIADAFDLGGRVLDVQPLGHGLINDTYLVTTDAPSGGRVVLQRINRRAFPQPELIMQNLRAVTEHVRARGPTQSAALRLPGIFLARDGRDFALDQEGGFWRVLGYFENSKTLGTVANARQAEEIGAALGRFHVLVSDLDPKRMHATRTDLHRTPLYFSRFVEAAARAADNATDADLDRCLAFAEARRAMVSVLEAARQGGELAPRVIHGDPKLDNFLFDSQSNRVVGLIDFDTVQPGLVHYDVGDCLRSCANPAGESPTNLDDVRFDLDICRAILAHYLAETGGFLTPRDYFYLYDAIRLIPFELGLRFLTDHLEGDTYFKIAWRGQNLHRATAQFRLTADIENSERPIKALIQELTRAQ